MRQCGCNDNNPPSRHGNLVRVQQGRLICSARKYAICASVAARQAIPDKAQQGNSLLGPAWLQERMATPVRAQECMVMIGASMAARPAMEGELHLQCRHPCAECCKP